MYDFLEPKPVPNTVHEPKQAAPAHRPRKKLAISIGGDGLALDPFASTHKCVHVHFVSEAERILFAHKHDDISVIFAFVPCTNLVIAGARWWKEKRMKDPDFQHKEVDAVKKMHGLLRASGAVPPR